MQTCRQFRHPRLELLDSFLHLDEKRNTLNSTGIMDRTVRIKIPESFASAVYNIPRNQSLRIEHPQTELEMGSQL